jgi:K+-transporting ATPase ATPase C chain
MAAVGRAFLAVAALTAVLGLAYPLAFTGLAQLVAPGRADGSLVERDGAVVGSRLAAQEFTRPEYFHPRPSGTTFSNLGPTSPDLAASVEERAQAILELEGRYVDGLEVGDIPVDAVVTSGSGIDPHISPAYARLQTPRVAEERDLPVERVEELVETHTDGRFLGLFGEPGVNTTTLNEALGR